MGWRAAIALLSARFGLPAQALNSTVVEVWRSGFLHRKTVGATRWDPSRSPRHPCATPCGVERGIDNAFQHGCLHAAVDEWINLHHLVNLARLAAELPAEQRQQLRRLKTVRLSCAAAYDATGCPELLDFSDPHRADYRRAIARARWTQGRPQRTTADGAWHQGHWLRIVVHSASLSPSPIDWLRVVARFSLVPAGFSDPISGRDRGLAGPLAPAAAATSRAASGCFIA